ncbi:hypothetical protein EOK96_08190 [Klebsiella oxytoca]|nr:hypothetical protein EOK96_08190 [Klebsiella oxytoca]
MAGAGSGAPRARCPLTLSLSPTGERTVRASLAPCAIPPFSLFRWERVGVRENLPPFFESHHNRRTPLFPFCPRRLN